MGVRINTNIEALNAQRNLNATATIFAKSVERLSSGLRINRAADDSAGLAVSEKLRAQVRGLNQAVRNAQDGISMIQTAEGALNEVHSMLQRMRELAVQASNDTLSDTDRGSINTELQALKNEVDRIATSTSFNGQKLLNGTLTGSNTGVTASDLVVGDSLSTGNVSVVTAVDVSAAKAQTYTFTTSGTSLTLTGADGTAQTLALSALAANETATYNFSALGVKVTIQNGSAGAKSVANLQVDFTNAANDTIVVGGNGGATFHIGAGDNDTLAVTFQGMSIAGLALTASLSAFNTGTATTTEARAIITALDADGQGLSLVSSTRASYGAVQNRLEHTIANLAVASENLTASESRIRDADIAAEMVTFTKTQILQQAGTAILAQANQAPQSVLSLLR